MYKYSSVHLFIVVWHNEMCATYRGFNKTCHKLLRDKLDKNVKCGSSMGKRHRRHSRAEAAICKEIIQCYGLEVIRPFDLILEKRESLGYHHKCYSRLTHFRSLNKKIFKRTRETAEIGKYRNIVFNL